MSDSSEGPRNKAERLAVAGAIAPSLRAQSDKLARRRISVEDKNGNVTGYISGAEFQKRLLERAKIELDVTGGKRPKNVFCGECGAVIPVAKRGYPARVCKKCRSCSDCGVELSAAVSSPSSRQNRKGPLCCIPCNTKRRTSLPVLTCEQCGATLSKALACKRASGESVGPPMCPRHAQSARQRRAAASKAWQTREHKAGTASPLDRST